MSTTKIQLFDILKENYDCEVPFHIQDIYQLLSNISSKIYDHLEAPNSEVLRDVQELRSDDLLTFVDYNETYFLNSSKSSQLNKLIYSEEHIQFIIEQLEKKAPEPEGDEIVFERWDCIKKDEIIDHEEAVRLNLPEYYQQRHGNDLFHDTVAQISDNIKTKGWMYNIPQPSVSELKPSIEGARLKEPIIGSDGKIKKYVLRNGRHRYCSVGDYLPCSVISAPHEDYLEKFGTTSNNPDGIHICNFTTESDAISAVRKWIKSGRLEPNIDVVKEYLKKWYPHITPNDRIGTASKILELEGHRESIRSWKQSEIRTFIQDKFNLFEGPDFKKNIMRYVYVMNNKNDDIRLLVQIMEDMINPKYKGFTFEVYASLGNRSGRDQEVTSQNITSLRLKNMAKWPEFVAKARKLSTLISENNIPPLTMRFVQQDNNGENPNEFHL